MPPFVLNGVVNGSEKYICYITKKSQTCVVCLPKLLPQEYKLYKIRACLVHCRTQGQNQCLVCDTQMSSTCLLVEGESN